MAVALETFDPPRRTGDDRSPEVEAPAPRGRPFLTAVWRDLAMLTYEADPRVLAPFVPRGTELDEWRGSTFVSLVGFMFCGARLFGVPVPQHQEFAEVNLRFYVRRPVGDRWRRGVVFIRELVGKRAVAWVARMGYGERFLRVPLRCALARLPDAAAPSRVTYSWRFQQDENCLDIEPAGRVQPPAPASLEEFIVEHYWAYTASRRGSSTEYRVVHRPWHIGQAVVAAFRGDARALYGPVLGSCLTGTPAVAFWADGSAVEVFRGRRFPT
jgi:uncharacterized protein YqjF (DUF2071 family)